VGLLIAKLALLWNHGTGKIMNKTDNYEVDNNIE